MNKNYKYTVTKILKDSFVLFNEIDKEYFSISRKMIDEYFKLPHCSTIESIQGKTINDNVTIFDIDSNYMSRNKIWTCLTRVVSLSQITIFINSDSTREKLTSSRYSQYFNFKIINYKKQDVVKNIKYDDKDYIDVKWFNEKLEKCVHSTFNLDIVDSVVKSNITVNKINNALPYIKTNCKLACIHCEVTSK
jgi:hypothetical protein